MEVTTRNVNDDTNQVIVEAIKSALQESMEDMNKVLREIKNTADHCCRQLQNWSEKSRGNNHTLKVSSFEVKDSSSTCSVGDLRNTVVMDSNIEVKSEKTDNARKVFDEMPPIRNLKQEGTVEGYYAEFRSLFGNTSVYESFDISLFIWGLQPEIKEGVARFEPKSLHDAYCLAMVQEATNDLMKRMKNPPLSPNLKLKDAIEVNDNNGLVFHDKSILVEDHCIGLTGQNKDHIEDKPFLGVEIISGHEEQVVGVNEEQVVVESIQTQISKEDESISTKIYVEGISYYSSVGDIQSFFEGCGSITEIDCLKFPKTNGNAMTSFWTNAASKRALALDESDMSVLFLQVQPYKSTRENKVFDFAHIMLNGYNRDVTLSCLSCDMTEIEVKNFFLDCNISFVLLGEDGLNPLIEVKFMEILLSSCMKT